MAQRKMSRQRRWQLDNIAAGKCKLCPEMRASGDSRFCEAHRKAYNSAQREYMKKRRSGR